MLNGSTYQWELGETTHYSEAAYRLHSYWNVGHKDDPSPRHQVYRSLYHLLRCLPDGERRQVQDELLAQAGVESGGRATHRSLSYEELLALAKGELIDVGSHTVTHPLLSTLPLTAQREEIQLSKAHLEETLCHPVNSFAYPYGGSSDYTSETVDIVQETGFTCGCANFAGIVCPETDCLQLPRVIVGDCNGEEFARRLGKWFRV